jgi:hypothetical protein
LREKPIRDGNPSPKREAFDRSLALPALMLALPALMLALPILMSAAHLPAFSQT